jgi:hypothetical protein
MAAAIGKDEMVRLARLGALARLQALDQERAQILASFPDLRRASASGAAAPSAAAATGRRRRTMSAANRKAVSQRMKKYWAERRTAKTAKA